MQYLMLIYTDEADHAAEGTPENDAIMNEYIRYTDEVREKKLYLGGNALHGVAMATTVRVRDGKTTTTDGPFAETKEQLGGYYLLDCENLDQAIEYAGKIPSSRTGSIEVRPVVELDFL